MDDNGSLVIIYRRFGERSEGETRSRFPPGYTAAISGAGRESRNLRVEDIPAQEWGRLTSVGSSGECPYEKKETRDY